MNCNVEITAVGTADGLEVSIHGGSVGMMTAAELIVARVLMAVADDEENLAGLKDSIVKNRNPPAGNSVEGFRAFMVRFS